MHRVPIVRGMGGHIPDISPPLPESSLCIAPELIKWPFSKPGMCLEYVQFVFTLRLALKLRNGPSGEDGDVSRMCLVCV